MEGTALFNPGVLGSGFLWWIGQVADDSTWRENIKDVVYDTPDDVPAWGYRYKVRIIGNHDQEEASITAEELPWAQVMYPVTSGGGQGGSYQTPAIKQGNFVFGFFIDGQDQQVPVIMGILGNNNKTKLERKTGTEGSGGKNFTPQSFHSKNQDEEPPEQKKLKDADLSPTTTNVSKESSDATHQDTTAGEKKRTVLTRKHALACPDPNRKSDMKNIQTVVETLSEKIQQFQKSMQNANVAAGLPIVQADKSIDAAIESASEEISKYMKGIMGQVQQFTTKEFNEKLAPMDNLAPPSHSLAIMKEKVAGLEKIACMFNGLMGAALVGLIAAALKNIFKKRQKESKVANPTITGSIVGLTTAIGSTRFNPNTGELETFVRVGDSGVWEENTEPVQTQLDTPGSDIIRALPAEGYYVPTPLCATEELVGQIIGETINTVMKGFDDAIGPVVEEIKIAIGGSSTDSGLTDSGSIDNSINENNVLAALGSGALVRSIAESMAQDAGTDPTKVGSVVAPWQNGDYSGGLSSLMNITGKTNASLSANATSLIDDKGNPTGISDGFTSVANLLSITPSLMTGAGLAFEAIRTGDVPKLVGAVGGLASYFPRVLNSIVGEGSSLAGAAAGGLGLGALGGMNFDIGSAMGFVGSITQIFNCDPKASCSPNDTHTMQGGGGDGGAPSFASVAESAKNAATSSKGVGKTLAERRSETSIRNQNLSQAEIKAKINEEKKVTKTYKVPTGTGGNFL